MADWLDQWEQEVKDYLVNPLYVRKGESWVVQELLAKRMMTLLPVVRAAVVVLEGVDRTALDEQGLDMPRWGFESDFAERLYRLRDALAAAQGGNDEQRVG